MDKIQKEKQLAYEYINSIPHVTWAQYTFPAPRFRHITLNIAESINSSWNPYRNLPILQLFTSTWSAVMSTIHLQRHRPHQSERLTDYARGILDANYQKARRCKVVSALDGLAQVYISDGTSHIVNLEENTCTCGEFQEFLIPCCHAVAICLWQSLDPYIYVHEWYSLEYYRQTYSCFMHPVREEDLVEEFDNCMAPRLTKQREWPKKKRIQREEQTFKTAIYGHCKQAGHNHRSCKNAKK